MLHPFSCTMTRKRARTVQDEEVADSTDFTSAFDHNILDCLICMKHLTVPIHQCMNGHVACPSCRRKENNVCPYCFEELGKIRNLALEKLLETLQVNCKYGGHGCDLVLKFTDKHSHENQCKFAPLKCKVGKCQFTGTELAFLHHFEVEHGMKPMDFTNNVPNDFELEIFNGRPINYILHGLGKLFILHTRKSQWGYLSCIIQLCPNLQDPEDVFSYELNMIDETDSIWSSHRLSQSRCQIDPYESHHIILPLTIRKVCVRFVIRRLITISSR